MLLQRENGILNLIIGSTALKHWFPDFPRNPKDLDVIGTKYASEEKIEFLKNPVLLNYCSYRGFLEPNDLYTLKMSHAVGWNINWDKHVFDIQFLKKKGCVINKELFNLLYNYWGDLHGINKRSDLDMSSEDFFNNALKLEHFHDFLHTLINEVPTFTKVLKGEVEVCESKFNNLSHEDKCNLVVEEVIIMAFERYKHLGFQRAYFAMLRKFIISHAPIWEAIFILENYIELHKPRFDYFKMIEDGIRKIK